MFWIQDQLSSSLWSVRLATNNKEENLEEGCIPVGRQLGLLWIKARVPSCEIIGGSITPKREENWSGKFSGIKKQGSISYKSYILVVWRLLILLSFVNGLNTGAIIFLVVIS